MMHLNGYFGHWQTWALIAGAWVIGSLVASLLMGVIARMGGKG